MNQFPRSISAQANRKRIISEKGLCKDCLVMKDGRGPFKISGICRHGLIKLYGSKKMHTPHSLERVC